MEDHNTDPEKVRMFRYVISRFSSFGPVRLSEAKEKVKVKTMENCRLDEGEYIELFEDLQKQNGWDDISAMAYFETSVMFEPEINN
jgi:hypothetical protein